MQTGKQLFLTISAHIASSEITFLNTARHIGAEVTWNSDPILACGVNPDKNQFGLGYD